MKFSIKGKEKIFLFKKSIELVCRNEDDFYLFYTKKGLRLFNEFSDTLIVIDFLPEWFAEF